MTKIILITMSILLCSPSFSWSNQQDDIHNQFRQAYCFYETKNYLQAAQLFEELEGKLPLLDEYWQFYLADALTQTNQIKKALPRWKQFLKQYPNSLLHTPAQIRYAEGLERSQQWKKAITLYEQLVKKLKKLPRKEIPRLYQQVAGCYQKIGNHKKSLSFYRRLYYEFPLAPETKETAALRKQLSKKVTSKVLPIKEKDCYLRIKILSHTFANKKRDKAIALYQKQYPQGTYQPQIAYELAEISYRSGKVKKAKQQLRKLSAKFPHHVYGEKAIYRLAQMNWNKHKAKPALVALDRLLQTYPSSRWSDDAVFLQARIKDSLKQRSEAIILYQKLATDYTSSRHTGDALWRGAWMSFQEKKYQQAAHLFGDCVKKARSYFIRDSARYWHGRSLEKVDKFDRAAKQYRWLMDKALKNYYSFEAKKRWKLIQKKVKKLPPSMPQTYTIICKHQHLKKRLKVVDLLLDLLLFDQAIDQLKLLKRVSCHNPTHNSMLANKFQIAGDYHQAIRTAYAYGGSAEEYQNIYPLNFRYQVFAEAEKQVIDPYLVMGLIRQESVFDSQALSRSGARGLMQIMPRTGKGLAKKLRIFPFRTDLLYDPDLNINLGTFYFANLLKEFKEPALAIAAYNAGENAVRRWLKKKPPIKDFTIFIENIPYPQTRTYVKKVLSHYNNYQVVYSDESK